MAHEGKLTLGGTLDTRVIRRRKVGLGWKLRNLPYLLRGWWKHALADMLGISHFYGTLHARVLKADGSVIDYGLISTRVVTTEFCAHLVDALDGTTTRISDYDFHGVGTGSTAEDVGDTALVAQVETRATGTPSQPTSVQYRSVGTVTATAQRLLREHGLFSAASGTDELMDRSVFALITLEIDDSIQATYTLSVSAGG